MWAGLQAKPAPARALSHTLLLPHVWGAHSNTPTPSEILGGSPRAISPTCRPVQGEDGVHCPWSRLLPCVTLSMLHVHGQAPGSLPLPHHYQPSQTHPRPQGPTIWDIAN